MAKEKIETTQEATVQEAPANQRVRVELPRGTKYAKFVSVNGVGYLIPAKGAYEVPPEVAEELARSLDAEDKRDSNAAELRAREEEKRAAFLRQIS